MINNKLIVAAAGSWKTTFLVNEALRKDDSVLITTFTEANEEEIKKKFIEINWFIPSNITIQTWFSFLLQHWVKPYQWWLCDKDINGLILVESQSWIKYIGKFWPVPYKEEEIEKHYFTDSWKIYSDKLSKFVIKANKHSKWHVINRIERVYKNIFVDEVQDLAWYDLEFIKLLFDSNSNILLVWDPRQVTYKTHYEKKYWKYKDGKIIEFIENECKKDICIIDDTSFNHSHRNNKFICDFSSKLYPDFLVCNSKQETTKEHEWIFLVKSIDVEDYTSVHRPQVLRYSKSIFPEINYGMSKWLWFDNVLIHPTYNIKEYLVNWDLGNIKSIIPKFYVAVTRARFSVWIIFDYEDWEEYIKWVQRWINS